MSFYGSLGSSKESSLDGTGGYIIKKVFFQVYVEVYKKPQVCFFQCHNKLTCKETVEIW